MNYSRFNIDESVALAVVAIAWIASLICGRIPVLNGAGEGLIQPFLLTTGAALSIALWRKSRSGDQQLPGKLLSASQDWRQGNVTPRVTHIGGKKRALQQLAWALNDLMDQVETRRSICIIRRPMPLTTMKEIVNTIHTVTVLMSEISVASDEQTSGIEQVSQAISQMVDVTRLGRASRCCCRIAERTAPASVGYQ